MVLGILNQEILLRVFLILFQRLGLLQKNRFVNWQYFDYRFCTKKDGVPKLNGRSGLANVTDENDTKLGHSQASFVLQDDV